MVSCVGIEVEWWLPRLGNEKKIGSQCLMGTVSVWEDEKVPEMDGGDGCRTI